MWEKVKAVFKKPLLWVLIAAIVAWYVFKKFFHLPGFDSLKNTLDIRLRARVDSTNNKENIDESLLKQAVAQANAILGNLPEDKKK